MEKRPEVLKRLSDQLAAWTASLPKTCEHGDDKAIELHDLAAAIVSAAHTRQ